MQKFTESAQRMTQMWAEFAQKMMSAGMGLMSPANGMPGLPTPAKFRQVRDTMLTAMAAWMDQYLRSPEFLELMRRNLEASMEMRQQFDGLLTKMHHASQNVARQDINALMQAIRHMEQRTLDRIEDLTQRVDDLGKRLEAAQQSGDREPPPARPSRRQPRSS